MIPRQHVEHEAGEGSAVRVEAVIVEQRALQAAAVDRLQELARDDLVRVDIGDRQRRRDAIELAERRHAASVRTSVRQPVTAAAAAMIGLTRWVRPSRP